MIFNGFDLLTYCGEGVSINKEIPPATIGRTMTTIGGGGGHILGHVESAPKTYTARINLHGRSMAEAWALKRTVAEWAMSSTVLADLIPTHDPARRYRAICQSVGDPEFKFGACTIDVVFFIPDPRMLAVEPRVFGGDDNTVSWRNEGTAEPILKVTFVGLADLSYPTIMLNNEAILTINDSILTGVQTVVDFDKKTVMINGAYAQDRINYMLTDWHPVFARDNTLSVEAATVTVEVIDRWL